MKKIFLSLLLSTFLIIPSISFATDSYEIDFISGASTVPHTVLYEGLVPCGNKICDLGQSSSLTKEIIEKKIEDFETNRKTQDFKDACANATIISGTEYPSDEKKICPCQFCHFFIMFKGLINFTLYKIIFPIAGLMLVFAGVMFFTAGGDPGKLNNAMKAIKATIIGLVIILAAWIIVNTFFLVLGITTMGGLTGESGTIVGIGANILNDNTKSWTDDQWNGSTLTITSGNDIGSSYIVLDTNGPAQTIIIDRDFNSAPNNPIAGDTYNLSKNGSWWSINCPIKIKTD